MAITTRELIRQALVEANVLAQGEVPSAADEQDAHRILKRLVDTRGADRSAIYAVERAAITLVSGTRDYSIGPGAPATEFLRDHAPGWIDRAGCVLDSTASTPLEIPIRVFTDAEWAGIRLKTLSASPLSGVWYERAAVTGTLSTYPTISAGNHQLVLYLPTPASGFDGMLTTYTFPPGYEQAWLMELALQMCGPWSVPSEIRARVKEQRTEAWLVAETPNARPAILHSPLSGVSARSSWSLSDFLTGGR